MERDDKRDLQRKIDLAVAWNILQNAFDGNKPRRFISGLAVSRSDKNSNGDALKARGMSVKLPVPLLWSHDWMHPIGKVVAIEAREDLVVFKAELSNTGHLAYAVQVWDAIVRRRATSISILARNLAAAPVWDRTFFDWKTTEISVVESGADRGARIQRAWQIAPCVSLRRPSETEIWNELPRPPRGVVRLQP